MKTLILLATLVSMTAQADWSALLRVDTLACTGSEESAKISIVGSTSAQTGQYTSTLAYSLNGGPEQSIPIDDLQAMIGAMGDVSFMIWSNKHHFRLGSGDPAFALLAKDGGATAMRSFVGGFTLPLPSGNDPFTRFNVTCDIKFLNYCGGKEDAGHCAKMLR